MNQGSVENIRTHSPHVCAEEGGWVPVCPQHPQPKELALCLAASRSVLYNRPGMMEMVDS